LFLYRTTDTAVLVLIALSADAKLIPKSKLAHTVQANKKRAFMVKVGRAKRLNLLAPVVSFSSDRMRII